MNIYDQLLEQIPRSNYNGPFRQGNYAIATDGKMMLAITGNKVEDTYPEQEKPNCLSFLQKKMNCSISFTRERLKSLYDRVPMTTKEECGACDRNGRVDFEFEYDGFVHTIEDECPICRGEGKVEISLGREIKNSDYKIRLSSLLFDICHVKAMIGLLNNLDQTEVVLCISDEYYATFVINNDVKLIVQTLMEDIVKAQFIIE